MSWRPCRSSCRDVGMTNRRYKFDVGDWVAVRDSRGEYRLAGKVVDADSESCMVQSTSGLRTPYVPGEDWIARVRWVGRGRWTV